MAQQAIHKFILGSKELEGKNAEFQYDRGVYTITDIVGEERTVVYKSRNAQEAYTKWNVYIGRKKERPQREYSKYDSGREGAESRTAGDGTKRDSHRDNRNRTASRNEKQGSGFAGDHTKEDSHKRTQKKTFSDDSRSWQGGQASRNDSYSRKKSTAKKKYKKDRRPRDEYKRSNNKIRNYRAEEE